jgi:hypothetical protein
VKLSANLRFSIAFFAAIVAAPFALGEDGWTEPVPVMNRAKIALTYRAKVAGDYLLVEASHSEGWHTYSMDNTVRARAATGDENPDSELPTRIAVSGGATVKGDWMQSAPKDMSQPSIKWYTWGFEGVARFAVPIEKTGDEDIVLTIDAQSCDPSSCTMVSDLKIVVPGAPGNAEPALIEGLVKVQREKDSATES